MVTEYRKRVVAGLWVAAVVALLLSPPLLAGPKIERWQTANGAKVLFVATPELPMVDIRMVFDAGSARDGDKPGLARLTAALLRQGAGDWNADQLAERMEGVGANFSTGSARDMAWVTVRSLTEPKLLDVALETLSAVVARPRFEAADFNRVREAMQVGLRQSEQNPGAVASKAFFAALFAGHPYASDPNGTQASLAAMVPEDLVRMHKTYYVARNAVVAIVGALDRKQAEAVATRLTAGLAEGEPAPALPEVAALRRAVTKQIDFPSSQSHIRLGQPGISRDDPDYFALYLGNHILGGGGFVSLLTNEVREKRGLSYSVYSHFSPMRRAGPFVMGAQTKNAQAQEALTVMRETLQAFIEQGPTQEQLTASKQNITGGFPLRIASNKDIVGHLAMLGFYDLPLDYLETFVDKIEAVTAGQIKEAFQRRLQPDRFVTIVVGRSE